MEVLKTVVFVFLVSFCYGEHDPNTGRFGDFATAVAKAKTRMNLNQAQTAARYSQELNAVDRGVQSLNNERLAVYVDRTAALLRSGELDDVQYNITEPCLNHTKLFLESVINFESWALYMLDAMGKPGSNLLEGYLSWPGSWEECIQVEAIAYEEITTKQGPSSAFSGKYCISSFTLKPQETMMMPFLFQSPVFAPFGQSVQLRVGMCFPDSCSPVDASQLAKMFASLIPLNATKDLGFPSMSCQERSLEYTTNAKLVIVICSLFVLVMAVATAYDYVINVLLVDQTSSEYEHLPTTMVKDDKHSTPKAANGHLGNGHVVDESSSLLHTSYKHDVISHHSEDLEKLSQRTSVYTPGMLGQLLLSFSVYSNAKKILSTNQPAGTLTSVNGIRFISMTWVVLGHTYAFGLQVTDNIATFLPKVLKRFSFQAIGNATFAVDTFFVLSGLLVAYLTLKEIRKRDGPKRVNWIMYYFHRFWRLTPPYMLFMMFYVTLMRYWGDGPFWPQNGVEPDDCNNWWTNLLYVNNLVKTDKMCMGWSWYLANDMQFYVLSPLLLIPLYYSRLWGSVVCVAFVLTNFISAGVISKHYSLGANMVIGNNEGVSFDKLYIKPWTRVGPYVVGIYTGYILYATGCKVKISKILNTVCWCVATAVAIMILYGLWTDDLSQKLGVDMAALYNATARTAWGMCIAWVIFSCATGHGGPINTLLSWRGIIPLSRLTYCAYLVHPVIMYTYYYSRRTLMHWYDLELTYMFLANLVLSYGVAFVVSLAFESPMMGLEKVLLGRGKRS